MGAPPMGGAPGHGNGDGAKPRQRFPRASGPVNSGGELYLRSHSGFGECALFDPATGAMRSAPPGGGSMSGVYGDMDGVPVILYRDAQQGLVLRVADQVFPVDRLGADAIWEHTRDFHRFAVRVEGRPHCEVRYRPVSSDADLGMLIRDVLADPARRSGIFG